MGVVPWKYGFNGDIETYRSRCRRKAEQEEKMHALEEQVASIEGAMATRTPSAPNMESSPDSQRRSSAASTKHPADNPQCYSVDDITVRTPCEHLYQQRKKDQSSGS
jgi:hypothetical protein